MKKQLGILLTPIAAGLMLAGTAMGAELQPVPSITDDEMKEAAGIYFDRCSGCHGTLRKGATGPNIQPAKTRKKSLAKLEKILWSGTDGGMPAWGEQGKLNKAQTELLARFVQNEPPAPPPWNMKEIKASWELVVPVDKRPTKATSRNWQNFFGVIQRDAGKVSIIDGDTKEILATLESGFAVHILRSSASGRYMYAIGRDGKATMIDIWAEPPNIVAKVRISLAAGSIDTSKFKGFDDKYVIAGGYWPPHYVIMKGDTLEPIQVVSTSGYTYDTGEFLREARVAAIVSSHVKPEWLLNVKETGHVLLVDYSNLEQGGTVTETRIEAERFLHDGGWDSTKRYFLAAANARDTISVIDTVERRLVANIVTGTKPHPGRGANWVDPEFGPVWATVHLGEGLVSIISTDPKSPKAWTVVREWELAGNSLFIKTHPNSKRVWCDNTINKTKAKTLTIFDIDNPTAPPKEMTFEKTVVHIEYNKAGDEVWVSLWDKDGELVIIDDKTMKIKKRITGLVAPTGKFNVYNTMHDIY